MSQTREYTVLPLEPKLNSVPNKDVIPLTEKEANYVSGMSGAGTFWLWVALWVVVGSTSKSFGIGVLCATIGTLVMVFAVKNSKIEEARRKKAENEKTRVERENEREINRSKEEAQSLTSSLARTYTSSGTLVSELPKHLSNASKWISKAEAEYKDSAFAPFWDAIEGAAQELSSFNDKAKTLSRRADEYYQGLNSRKHTFPAFPVDTNTIPDPSLVIKNMGRIIRMGQTNYQFAAIWEHRRTREVLIAGFHTLGEAVNNLGATIDDSIFSLQSSLSSDLATISKEQIRTRESLDSRLLEQNRMLDNIQNQRKPEASDTPTKY